MYKSGDCLFWLHTIYIYMCSYFICKQFAIINIGFDVVQLIFYGERDRVGNLHFRHIYPFLPFHFLQSRSLTRTELRDKKLSKTIAKKLAYFHTLEMPLTKQPNFLRKQMNE